MHDAHVFAILGLRALYFLLSGTMSRFYLPKYGLAVILGFVGLKMVGSAWVHIPVWLSLAVIVGVLANTVASVLRPPPGGGSDHEPGLDLPR